MRSVWFTTARLTGEVKLGSKLTLGMVFILRVSNLQRPHDRQKREGPRTSLALCGESLVMLMDEIDFLIRDVETQLAWSKQGSETSWVGKIMALQRPPQAIEKR